MLSMNVFCFSVCVCFVILEVHHDFKGTPADLSAS